MYRYAMSSFTLEHLVKNALNPAHNSLCKTVILPMDEKLVLSDSVIVLETGLENTFGFSFVDG